MKAKKSKKEPKPKATDAKLNPRCLTMLGSLLKKKHPRDINK